VLKGKGLKVLKRKGFKGRKKRRILVRCSINFPATGGRRVEDQLSKLLGEYPNY